MKDYIKIVYNEHERPITKYPEQLTEYLFYRFKMKKGDKLLDNGCGRGDFLFGFAIQGLECYGTDISGYLKEIDLKGVKFFLCDIEKEKLPFDDNFFDIVFTKSVIEHFYDPNNFMKECYRVLKPGGRIIVMTPDWKSTMFIFYDDPTHVHPYTTEGVRELILLHGFNEVSAEIFYQLPIIWKYPLMKVFSCILRLAGPVRKIHSNKFIRWSRELMILGTGVK